MNTPPSSLFHEILLIEDDPSHTLLIKRVLTGLGSSIIHVSDLASAYELLKDSTPELIISDLHLPDSSGVSHIERLSELSDGVPVIVLTSSTNLSEAVEAMKTGARDFIVKDFSKNFREVISLSLNRVYATTQLEQERRKLETAVQNSDDGLAVVSATGIIRYSNSAFERFVRMCGGEAPDFFSLLTERVSKSDQLKKRVETALLEISPGEVRHFEFSLTGEDSKSFDLSVSGIEKRNVDAKEVIIWVRDITEQRRREKFQREMLSTTTHDLKGPLGAVLTGSELLSSMVETERAKQLVIRIQSATQGVVNLIDEFLSARRIEEGSFVLKPKPFSAQELVENVRLNFETIAEARSIALSCSMPEDLIINVDKIGFERVLGNLLSNAIKFTGREGKVDVKLEQEEDDVILTVTDTGTGMEPSEVKMVFERFSRLEKHQETHGTGIGLFVVRSIVDAHGGQIEVLSKVGAGTTFKIYFPLHPPVNERGELFCLD